MGAPTVSGPLIDHPWYFHQFFQLSVVHTNSTFASERTIEAVSTLPQRTPPATANDQRATNMFKARKFSEPPAKRNALLTPRVDPLTALKRQRTDDEYAVTAAAPASSSSAGYALLGVEPSADCAVAVVNSLPANVRDQVRDERPSAQDQQRNIHTCRAWLPTATKTAGSSRGDLHYVFVLRTKVLVWQPEQRHVLSLELPDDVLEQDEAMTPFLLYLYGQGLSLMLVSKSGLVLFWEDIELSYENTPLSVQIPLQPQESVMTHAEAGMPLDKLARSSGSSAEALQSVFCWSNQGNVWEIAMEDRRIRVRTFEKRNAGFLSGLTKSVSQFFFASAGASSRSGTASSGLQDPNLPVQYAHVIASAPNDGYDSMGSEDTADLLVLYANGMIERKTFNVGDALDCSSESRWQIDAHRTAISYFSEHFPEYHLAKVTVVSFPYVNDDSFAVLVAYVCSSRQESSAKVKYATFHFSLVDNDMTEAPEPEWTYVLDYEPAFVESEESERYFHVESFPVTRQAFYLVWTKSTPVQVSSVLLPESSQGSVRSAAFSLQGLMDRSACAFGLHTEPSPYSQDALKGSVSFILLDDEVNASTGSVCAATASNMQKLEVSRSFSGKIHRPAAQADSQVNKPGVEGFTTLLMTHFHEDPHSSSTVRIGNQEIPAAAQAAVSLVFEILDAKSSSGLRWGTEFANSSVGSSHATANVAHVTPKLVRYQLEEKRSRHVEFLKFLENRCGSIWQYIQQSSELKRYLIEAEEKLHAAIALSKFQGSIVTSEDDTDLLTIQRRLTGQFLLHAIDRTVEQRGYDKEQLRMAGYSAFDVFYCEVSKLPELFQHLNVELEKLASSIGESDPTYLYALLESGCSMLSMLRVPALSASARFAPTGSWMFTHQVREIILEQISRSSGLIGYSKMRPTQNTTRWEIDEVLEITEQIEQLGTVLLDAYVRFLPTKNGEEAEELRKETERSKRIILNPLVYIATTAASSYSTDASLMDIEQFETYSRKRISLFTKCVALCEKYAYFEGMIFLVYVEDEENVRKMDYALGKLPKSSAAKRLESYCKEYEKFPHFLYCWYAGKIRHPWLPSFAHEGEAQSRMLAYLLANTHLFGPSLHQYVKEDEHLSAFAWCTSVSVERYDQTTQFALRDAQDEFHSLPKRKTMASIAKIAALAMPKKSRNEENMNEVRREVLLITFRLPPNVCRK